MSPFFSTTDTSQWFPTFWDNIVDLIASIVKEQPENVTKTVLQHQNKYAIFQLLTKTMREKYYVDFVTGKKSLKEVESLARLYSDDSGDDNEEY